ncbi:YopX family protein [Streptococcus suis]|uniref:YopX family protein n=1 Tax=Streptococcus suis TaxID=1307 RepID=UPI0003F51FFD|nr:YopX family protein [Streptococcus suis]
MIPKFRAWDIFHNKWVKHFYITENGLIYNMEQLHRDLIGAVPIEQSGLIVMQSTGLFDKNGQEIFEGDIIVAMSQGVKAIGEVKRRIDGYWLMYPSWQHGELWHIVENVDTGETGVEIIGNIYENPELMEGLNEK